MIGATDSEAHWRLTSNGAGLVPESLDAMTWTVGNHGFTMTLSPRVPSLIEEQLQPWMEAWLAQHGLRIPDVGSWAIHPGGARIVSSAEKALSLESSAGAVAREVLAEHGNMSSPTVLFVLKRLMDGGAPPPVRGAGVRAGAQHRGGAFHLIAISAGTGPERCSISLSRAAPCLGGEL